MNISLWDLKENASKTSALAPAGAAVGNARPLGSGALESKDKVGEMVAASLGPAAAAGGGGDGGGDGFKGLKRPSGLQRMSTVTSVLRQDLGGQGSVIGRGVGAEGGIWEGTRGARLSRRW